MTVIVVKNFDEPNFVVSWSLLFPWSLNTEYRRRKKQHLSAKVSQWEWKPYEDERHEHVCECVVG